MGRLHTVSQYIRVLCYPLQGLPVAASAGHLPPDLQRNCCSKTGGPAGWPCTPAAAHRRYWSTGGSQRQWWGCVALHLEGAGLSFIHGRWEETWDVQLGLCGWDVLLCIEATSRVFFHAWKMSSFHYPYILWCQMCLWPTLQNSRFF